MMAYFPNATAGDVLDRQCGECLLGEEACPVLFVQMQYNYDQLNKGNEKLKEAMTELIDDKGICQVGKHLRTSKVKQFCEDCGLSFGIVERHSGNVCCSCNERDA